MLSWSVSRTIQHSHLDASVAKAIAVGDIDPVTLFPMKDINPGFVPRTLKALASNRHKGKGKAKGSPVKDGILSFFGAFRTLWILSGELHG